MPPLLLVLALVPLQKFAIDFKVFQWKCPLQNKNGLALLKNEIADMLLMAMATIALFVLDVLRKDTDEIEKVLFV